MSDHEAVTDAAISELGHIVWFSSEEEGGPDCGLSLGLGEGCSLYVGEMPTSTLAEHDIDVAKTGDGWWVVLYGDKRTDTSISALVVDNLAAQELVDHLFAVIQGLKQQIDALSPDTGDGTNG